MNKTILILFTFWANIGFSQNLIPNPSFEDYQSLPTDIAQGIRCISTWTFPNFPGQGDYYHTKSQTRKAGTKNNYFGKQPPHSGNAYVGICISKKFREYLQVKLIHPLINNKQYKIQVFISCADKIGMSTVNEFHIIFSKKSFKIYGDDYLLVPPKIKITKSNKYENKKEWQELTIDYTANGTEQYMTFGTFRYKENEKEYGELFGISQYAHYYVDDFSIIPITEEISYDSINTAAIEKIDTSTVKGFVLGKTYIFNNLLFETGKTKLLSNSFPELNNLINYLLEHPKVKIKIVGHTDNIGGSSDNLKLSYERANTVMQYLISNKSIDEKSISIEGKGDNMPLESNNSDIGRKRNRRVEISFL